jgi:predicted nicotinamide N-methyase
MLQAPFDTSFVTNQTHIVCGSLVPEIPLHLLNPKSPLGQFTESDLETSPCGAPYWAFAWSGSQAIARYLLDNPEKVANLNVLDFASGCGLAAIAAAHCGAKKVIANDIDPICQFTTELNANLNQVSITYCGANLLNHPLPEVDIILAGDVCYEEPLATQVINWLQNALQSGVQVLLGDPGRTFLPKSKQQILKRYHSQIIQPWEDTDVTRACIREILPSEPD